MGNFAAMNRDQVIQNYKDLLDEFGLSTKDLWLGGGSAMILYGLRETTADLDAGAHLPVLKMISRKTGNKIKTFHKSDGYLKDNTHLLTIDQFATDLHDETEVITDDLNEIDGVMCYTPEKLLAQKKELFRVLKRDKDIKDIENLERYIRNMKK